MIKRRKKTQTYNRQQQDSVAARVNSDRADWEMSNANEFTHGTHDRNLNPATPAEEEQGDAFDPVYQFKWGKWWFMYRSTWVSILLLPIAFRKGLAWGGLAIAGIVGRTLLLGSSIVELWGLRISAWYIWLFDGELLPDGMIAKPTFGNLPIPGVGFYDEPPDYAGGVGRSW